ncbi:hypothetical protein [Phycicoccus sp.]|uniref:hypothetical protein n=1 Tax=Phycicoccus sp. TaxID=1902410 RepID=UPI002BA721C7|nr:hypothetical protein [Phycicoccus sp.]HMM94505.1 hypothetical protein [Phycicoccus sp.]
MTSPATPTDDHFDEPWAEPDPLRSRERADRQWLLRDPLRTVFVLVTVIALAVRFNVLRDSFFITDDFMLSSRAVESPFGWDYLGRVHTGHFEPVGFAVMWVLAHVAPWNWGAAVAVMLAGLLVVFLLVWSLLVELFGRRWTVLVPYGLFCFTPLTLPATTWLSAAILWVPLMASVAGTTKWHVRYLRTGRVRDAVVAVLFLALGLLSFEKTLVVLPYLVVLTFAVLPRSRVSLSGVRRVVRSRPTVWVLYAVLTGAYLVAYAVSLARDEGAESLYVPTAGQVWDFTYLSVFRTFVPSSFGGPWSWAPVGYGGAIVDSPRLFDWVALVVAALVITVTVALRRRMARHWAALGTYVVFGLAALAAGRVALGGAIMALETRYLGDAAVPLAVALGAALSPLRGEPDAWYPVPRPLLELRRSARRVGALSLVAVLALSLYSMNAYASISSANPYRPFVESTAASMRTLPRDAQLYDTALPVDIVGPIFQEYNLVSRFIEPQITSANRRNLTPRPELTKPYILDASGHFVPMKVDGAASPAPLPGACGWVARNGTVTVPLGSDVFAWGWAVRIGYLADGDTTATVRLGTGTGTVHLREGLGEVYLPLVGSGPQVELQGMDPRVNVCVGDVQVGNPVGK